MLVGVKENRALMHGFLHDNADHVGWQRRCLTYIIRARGEAYGAMNVVLRSALVCKRAWNSVRMQADLFQSQPIPVLHADDQPLECGSPPPSGSSCVRNHTRSPGSCGVIQDLRGELYLSRVIVSSGSGPNHSERISLSRGLYARKRA